MNNSYLKNFGIAYILSAALVIVANYAIYNHIFIAGHMDETIKNIIDQEQLFRVAIFLDLLYVLFFTIAFTNFYAGLKTAVSHLALIGFSMHLLYIFIFLAETVDVLGLFRLINSQIHLKDPDRFALAVKEFVGFRFDRYYGGLPMHSLGSIIFSYILFKTKSSPTYLSTLALLGWIICFFCSLGLYAVPGFLGHVHLWLYDTLSTLSFLLLGGYFMVRFYYKK